MDMRKHSLFSISQLGGKFLEKYTKEKGEKQEIFSFFLL